MSTSFSPQQEQLVSQILSSGQYETEAAVIDEALELLRQRDDLRCQLQIAVQQLDDGQGLTADEVIDSFSKARDTWQ